MLAKKRLLLAKIESTYGVDATPTGAANAVVTKGVTVKNYEGQKVNRDIDRPILGNDESINVGPHTTVSFDIELSGSGAAGTAPAYGPLLRACGLSETVTVSTDTVYAPVSSNFESVTLYVHIDEQLHKVPGARGTVEFKVGKGGLPMMSFSFTGLHAKPITGALPAAPDFSGFSTPIPVTKFNTPVYTVHGFAAVAEDLSVSLANQVNYRNVVNSESVQIVDRAPSGSITIEAPAIASKDFYAAVEGNTLGAVEIQHGTVAGNIIEISLPQSQLQDPVLGESDGIGTLQMSVNILPTSAGDDEFVLTVR